MTCIVFVVKVILLLCQVCSVPLSAKDLEKQSAKELEKWRKDKPSSTFDPRGRCHGFQMAWERARQNKEDRQRKERETGNLSVPIARSASTLSLSPSLLHKRWRKGGKPNTGEWEGGGKVVRHLSMGAKEDFNSWTELNFEKVQDLEEEDVVCDEHTTKRETNLAGQTEVKEVFNKPIKTDTIQNIEDTTTTTANEQIEKAETGIIEKEGGEPISEQTEETNVAAELNQGPVNNQTVDNMLPQLSEPTSQHHQEDKMGSCNQSQFEEQQNHQGKDQNTEVKDINVETEKQVVDETEHSTDVQENQSETHKDATANTNKKTPRSNLHVCIESTEVTESEMKPGEGLETNNIQQRQVDTELSASDRTDSRPGSEKKSNSEETACKDPDLTETQQQQEEAIIETDTSSSGDVLDEVKHCVSESVADIGIETEPVLTQTQDREDENASSQEELEAEIVVTEAETLILSSLNECTDTEAQAAARCIEASEGSAQRSETEWDTGTCELTQEEEQIIVTVHIEEKIDSDHTEAEETPSETQTDSSPPLKEEAGNLTPDSDWSMSAIETSTGEPAPEANTEDVNKSIIISPPSATDSPHSDNIPQVQEKGPSQTETDNPTQATGRRSSRSSGDFCVRRSSNSHGSRLARRLSEDLFTSPQKTSHAQSSASQEPQHAESQSEPVFPTLPEVSQSPDVKPPLTEAQQEPQAPSKRFGLFRRLRGEQPKKAKEKATQKIQVPKILIQDFSDGRGKPVEEVEDEKLNSRERRRRRRVQERREKEEERLWKKKERELEKERERERRKPQTRGKSFQVQKEKGGADTGSKTFRHSTSYAESYF